MRIIKSKVIKIFVGDEVGMKIRIDMKEVTFRFVGGPIVNADKNERIDG